MKEKITITIMLIILLAGCARQEGSTGAAQRPDEVSAAQSQAASPETTVVDEPLGRVEIIGGDEQALREFVLRWFKPLYPSPGSQQETRIWIGALPDNENVTFPIPDGARVIGSLQDPYVNLQVLVDAPGEVAEVLQDYQSLLVEAGWVLAEEPAAQAGFITSADPWYTYCLDQDQAALSVQAFSGDQGQTELRLNLYTRDLTYMCNPNQDPGMDPAYEMLPTLTLPVGAWMTGGGTSSGGGSADGSTEIQTSLSTADLAAHFLPQMAEAGWQLLGEGSEAAVSWSSWTRQDEQGQLWYGNLVILDNQGDENRVYALVHVAGAVK